MDIEGVVITATESHSLDTVKYFEGFRKS
jgi:hypothetical protein